MAPRKASATPKKTAPVEETEVKTPRGRSRSRSDSIKIAAPASPEPVAADKKHEIHYEFGGPVGCFFIIIGLPIVIYSLFFLCNKNVCMTNPFSFNFQYVLAALPLHWKDWFSHEANVMYLGWLAFHVLLERILPGDLVDGVPLKDKSKLKYTMSGHLQFWVTLVLIFNAYPILSWSQSVCSGTDASTCVANSVGDAVVSLKGFAALPLEMIYDHYLQLISISVVSTATFSLYLYTSSFIPSGKILAAGGDTGSAIYDYFIGRELNPRIGSLDLKEFCELRPGLIGWFVINIGMCVKQYQNRLALDGVGSCSLSIVLVTVLQGFYVWDALYQEKAILTTMDITTDGFGFMLCFGDLSWVPFIYSLQARYLVDYDPQLNVTSLAVIVAIQLLGYYIFRSANSQKDSFRKDPDGDEVKHLTYLQTKRGTRLLTSGWWGMARKINYTGDWLVTFSWCLLCGFNSPIPYFQALYFAILLIHRAIRDDEMCHEKYGDDWLEYKKRVPYMFIPYVI